MLSLPVDVVEAIIRELTRNDKATVKSLSLVCSSLTLLCQQHILSHVTISCARSERKSNFYRRSSCGTQELLQSSPHLIHIIRSLSIVDSGTVWTQIDTALLYILRSLTNLSRFSWRSSFVSSSPTHWDELPLPLQDAIRFVIRHPSLNALTLQFADLTSLFHKPVDISPSLTYLGLRGSGYSNLTLQLTHSNEKSFKDSREATRLFVTACKLEWIEDDEKFLGWMSNVRPLIDLARLRKLVFFRSILNSASDELPWGTLLSCDSVRSTLEDLWFDITSMPGLPNGITALPALRRLGLTAILSGVGDATWNLISGIAQLFEALTALEITHVALGFSFSTTSLVLNPDKTPWLRLDAAVAALPALQWVGIQVIDCRCELSIMVPEKLEDMLPLLSEKGVIRWLTSKLEFPK